MKTFVKVAGLGVALAAFAGSAHAAVSVDVLFSKKAGHPTAQIPGGAKDSTGTTVPTEWRALEDLIVHPNGNDYLIRGRNQIDGSTTSSLYDTIVFAGNGSTGSVIIQESQPIVGGSPGELYDFIGSNFGRYNAAGNFAFTARAKGGVASVFHKVMTWNGTTTTIVYQMGGLITGLADAGVAGDETFGNSVGVGHFLNDGRIGLHDTTIGNIASSRRPAVMYNNAGFRQSNVSVITNFEGTGTVTFSSISNSAKGRTFEGSPDGSKHAMVVTIVGEPAATDTGFVVNDRVTIQEGKALPGDTVIVNDINFYRFLSNNSWIARGNTVGGGGWASRDGVTLAKTGGTISGAETWAVGQSFQAIAALPSGDWAIMGRAEGGTITAANDDVLVLNGNRVILREGDPVDLDGNGQLDDNAFIGRGNNTLTAWDADELFLTSSGVLYAIVNLRDGAGADLNSSPSFGTPQALIKITVTPDCVADVDDGTGTGTRDGGVGIEDLLYYLGLFEAGTLGADVDDGTGTGTPDGGVGIEDLLYFLLRFEAGC